MWLLNEDCCGDDGEEGETLNGEIEDVICFPLIALIANNRAMVESVMV
jgi:hypothetical protein